MRSNLAQKLSIARPGEAAKQAGALTDQLQATLVVTCLKAMQWSLVYGDQVSSLLQASTVWAQYESQKHDLFIEDKPVAGYLTSQVTTNTLTSIETGLDDIGHWTLVIETGLRDID